MINNITIRKAEIADIPQLIKMNDEFNEPGATFESMKNSLENNKSEIVFVATCGGKAVGFVCGQLYQSICYNDGFQCELTELFISRRYRKMGIATRLVKHLEGEFAQNNGKEIILKTGVNNTKAQALYESLGYRKFDEVLYFKEL